MPTVSDTTVVASAYDTSGNGGWKLVRLSNGWLISAVYDSANIQIKFSVSKDNGQTWSQLCYIGVLAYSNMAIANIGNKVYCLTTNGSAYVRTFMFDATTVTNIDLFSTRTDLENAQTTTSGGTLIINDTGTELHAAWSSKNSTYANSFNIRYSKGTINGDGSVTWGSVTQVTTRNVSGSNLQNPSITIKNSVPIMLIESNIDFNTATTAGATSQTVIVALKNDKTLLYAGTGTLVDSAWSAVSVYNPGSYAQSNPSAIFVPTSINGLANGRIGVAWHGRDSTDTSRDNIRYSYSDDGGVTWSAMAKLTNGNLYDQNFVTITANKNNEIFVLWGGNDATDLNQDVRMIKNSSGSWGAFSVVANGTTQHKRYPSALYDFNFNFSSPLFIYQDAQNLKVGFYGTWTITTISVTQGDIGTKTSADKANLLTYSITTDGTMATITEKVNGTTIGTKTATSGQSLIAGLTQAQWDAIIYGKYADATGGENTLTVSMGTDTWTYTFDKRLATTDDINATIKAAQDNNNTALAAKKALLGAAIRAKGGTVNDTDMLETMVSAITNANNKRWASGTATSSASTSTFTAVGGGAASGYPITVSGLSFKPSTIIYFNTTANGGYEAVYTYSTAVTFLFGALVTQKQFTSGDGTTTVYDFQVGGALSVISTGFTLPTSFANTSFNWIAYE